MQLPPIDINVILAIASLLLFVGLVGYFAFLVKHQEEVEPEREVYGVELLRQHYEPGETIEQPTPYWVSPIPASPDPLEISANLDKKIVFGAAMLFGLFALVGAYFLIQPAVRAEAADHQIRLDVRRGKALYASLCYDCHGRDGRARRTPEGGQLPGLPLNKPDFKYENVKEDPSNVKAVQDLLQRTIERGRMRPAPAYSMPAWSRTEGGPLGHWQVKQLVDLIVHGTEEDWADIVHVRQEHEEPVAEQIPPPPAPPSGEEVAKSVCAACHSFAAGRNSPNPLS
ncbi:MAG: c-type cytochrome, partial [Chloroflexota bacterium]